MVSLVLVFDDVVARVIFLVSWVLVPISYFFDDFLLFSIFSVVIILLIFMCRCYLFVLIFGLIVFVCDWGTWDPLKIWIPLDNICLLLLSVQVFYPAYDLIIYW